MKIAQINMLPYGSTGKIMFQIAQTAREHGHSVKTFSTIPFDKDAVLFKAFPEEHFVFGSYSENKIHCYLGIALGRNGMYSHIGTAELIKQLKLFNPDVVHLHNLHKFCVNLPMLFGYLKKSNVKVVWTLHDCWAFTGQCPYFTMVGCEKWKTGCHNCTQIDRYPKSLVDNTRYMYNLKKKWFTGIKNMVLVTPSQWLADLVQQSFLKSYPVKVIHNGIDIGIFKPTINSFRDKYDIPYDKKILLGVAFDWGLRKGLDVFCELAKRMDAQKYTIVLVGTNDIIDKQLPTNIISIHKTHNQEELAEIYSAADLFVNTTREENYPTVNMESIACGTPVLTFRTGGSPEIPDENSGSVVACDDIDALEKEIIRICETMPYSESTCVERAKLFEAKRCFEEYAELYSQL